MKFSFAALFTILMVSSFALARPAQRTNPNLMTSWGSEEEYEIQSSLSGGGYESKKQGTTTVSTLQAKISMAKSLKNNIQVGGEVEFSNTSGGSFSGSYFEVAGFGVYNFSTILKDTFYVKGGAGLYNTINTRQENENKFGFFAGGGKRFPLWNQITYSPEARIWKIGDQDITFSFYFLNLSLFF